MKIYTIGHSNRTLEDFLSVLRTYGIQVLADVRAFPGSTRYPHFGKANLGQSLEAAGIRHVWMGDSLGGYRKEREGLGDDSPNKGLRSLSFRAYADYMRSAAFQDAASKLMALARQKTTVYMCAEKLYWRCHRLLISDYLASLGCEVGHIIDEKTVTLHKLSSAARITDGVLSYPKEPEKSAGPIV